MYMVLLAPFKSQPNIVKSFILQALTSSMRTLLNKHSSTKAERKFHEILKELHIPFQSKVKIMGREIDFIVKNYAIEIDGHHQDISKNWMLRSLGYNPIHFNNNEIPNPNLIEWLKNLK